MNFPASIRTVALISPAGPVPPEALARAVSWFQAAGVTVRPMAHLNAAGEATYTAGAPELRAADLMAAWRDPEVDLVLAVRGGFGSAQLLPLLDWELLRTRPLLPLGGYSDLTALHWAMVRHGAGRPLVMPMAVRYPELDEFSASSAAAALSGAELAAPQPLIPLAGGACAGLPLPGNLTVAATLCGTPDCPEIAGRILMLEDVNEPVYRLDRALTQLEQSGIFRAAAGVVFGSFHGCGDPGKVEGLLRRFARRVSCPVWCGLPFGHEFPLLSLPFWRNCRIGADGVCRFE